MTRAARSNSAARSRSADVKPFALRAFFGLALLATALVLAPRAAQAAVSKKAASTPKVIDECSWDNPGLHPFMGNVVNAIDRYKDIPAPIRARLKERMEARSYDEFVTIEKNGIVGQRRYEPGITEMHFGNGSICRNVTRTKWTPAMKERGLVYCEQNHCILVPTVCRNVSRIRRVAEEAPPPQASRPEEPPADEGGGLGGGEGGGYSSSGWLMVQARQVQEPGYVTGGCGCGGMSPVPFMPPFSGGVGGPGTGPGALQPVPEPETWLMYGVGLLAVMGLARRRKLKSRS